MDLARQKNFNLRLIAIFLCVFIAISPIYSIRKVKAEIGTIALVGGVAIVGIILTSLASQGIISGDYTVSAPDLTAITEKAQANLQAAGANAVEQANRLGEAIKSGAESAKIKALASGAVIYAFLQAIQETLFPDKTIDRNWGLRKNEVLLADFGDYVVTKEVTDTYAKFGIPSRGWALSTNIFKDQYTYVNDDTYFDGNWGPAGYLYCRRAFDGSVVRSGTFYCMTKTPSARYSIGIGFTSYAENKYLGSALGIQKWIDELSGNAILNNDVTHIASAPSVNLPTRLPTTIVNNINNWDGTSDLVLAPPLPYDIPQGEDLVIDPSYTGSEVEDPDTPDVPDTPEEGNITLPWLAALLGLLGLGQLTGIDEGVKSGIDNLVDSITNTAQDVYDGVRDWADTARSTIAQGIEGVRAKLGEIAGVITGGLALGIEGIQSALGSIAETIGHAFDPPSKNVDWDKLKNIQLFNKFPFSIPSDLYYLFGLVAADPVAPCVKIPFDMTFLGGENIEATVDLATYDNVAAIIRSFEFIAFVIGMLYLTKSLIWK